MITLTLPAIHLPDQLIDTPHGALRIPGHRVPARQVPVDPAQLATLVHAARQAARNAHAPYSRFRVGAALIMADDPTATVYSGANIENSSFGGTCCGERSALVAAASRGLRRIRYLAVSCADNLTAPLAERSPCGICRQVIKEFTHKELALDDALILIDSGADDTLCEVLDIERLLPYGFNFAPPAGHGTHSPAGS